MNQQFLQCEQLLLFSLFSSFFWNIPTFNIQLEYISSLSFVICNMKTMKTQPTSYKDFLELMGKAKDNKAINPLKNKQTPKANNYHPTSIHNQSTSLLEKRSPSQNRLNTELSSEKRIRSYNQSYNQSHNQSIQGQKKPISISKKDNILCYQKFVNEITGILNKLLKIPVPQLLNHRISYIEYLEVLKLLKMIYENYQPYPNDLVSELWGQCISGQNIGNFVITICAILGLYESKVSQQDKYIKSKYGSLRYTRLQLSKPNQNQSKQNECTFTPMISERSRRLATSRSKQKKNSKKEQTIDNGDRMLTQRNKSINFYENKYSINDDETDNMLFNIYDNTKLKNDFTGNKRSNMLYEKARQKSTERRQNKTTNQIQYERNIKELTFKPIINTSKSKNNEKDKQPKYPVRGEKNTISRMIRGRVEREVRKIINEKGVPYNEKIVDKMRKQKYEQISTTIHLQTVQSLPNCPAEQMSIIVPKINKQSNQINTKPSIFFPEQDIVIDVYLSEDHKQKLIVRRGENLEELASKFIQKHGLQAEKKEQLIQMLQVSMKHALCPIDQLVQEQEELASARTHYKRQYCR